MGTASTLLRLTVAVLILAERLLTLVVGTQLVTHGFLPALVPTALFAVVALVRRGISGLHADIVESRLADETISAMFGSDPFGQSAGNWHSVLLESVPSRAQTIAIARPTVLGEALACVVVVGWFVHHFEPHVIGTVLIALACGLGLALWFRSFVSQSAARSWVMRDAVIRHIVDAVGGRSDIVGNCADDQFRASFRDALATWRSASRRARFAATAMGRAPIAAAIIVTLAVVAAWHLSIGDLILIAVGLPPLAGLMQGMVDIVRDGRSGLDAILRSPRRPNAADAPDGRIASVDIEVTHTYPNGLVALDGIQIRWKASDALVVVGENGSGKSTLLRLFAGMPATKGTVSFDGHAADAWRRRVAFLPQRPYFPAGTVKEAIRFTTPTASDHAIDEALHRVDFTLGPSANVEQLSAGERQRVALARILVRPNIALYVLDEPEANLDGAGVAMVCRLIRELVDGGAAVVCAAHGKLIAESADRVVALHAGKIAMPKESARAG